MEKQKKQNILTIIIVIAAIALVLIVGEEIYSQKVKGNKKNQISEPETENTSNTNTIETEKQETKPSNTTVEVPKNDYVGEEEKESEQEEDTTKTTEEKAIELAKKTWGETDTSVTYSIEQKDGNKYYVAVKKDATVQMWYEIDTETWEIKEY